MNFLEKLDFLMDKYGLNKRSLSQKSDIPYTTIDAWYKKGYEGLKLTTLRKLNDFFNTTLDYWILDEITDPNYGKTSGFKVNYEEMEHIKKYRLLDASGQEHIDTVLQWESDRMRRLRAYAEKIQEMQESKDSIKHSSYIVGEPVSCGANAAHDDKDSTLEDRKAGDAIMTDDSEWE